MPLGTKPVYLGDGEWGTEPSALPRILEAIAADPSLTAAELATFRRKSPGALGSAVSGFVSFGSSYGIEIAAHLRPAYLANDRLKTCRTL
jgi:hypothetical protein